MHMASNSISQHIYIRYPCLQIAAAATALQEHRHRTAGRRGGTASPVVGRGGSGA